MKVKVSLLLIGVLAITSSANTQDLYQQHRQKMVAIIKLEVVETVSYTGIKTLNPKIIQALMSVPRHEFVPRDSRPQAYNNNPLPIGKNQTISQPYIVAIMTELLTPQPHHKVLEIGTGSGYQAAILSRLAAKVFTIEVIPELAEQAKLTLKKLHTNNVTVRTGNGYLGWPEQAPFDGIIVTAGGELPEALIQQLKPGGRMIIPLGAVNEIQYLTLITKDVQGQISQQQILPVRFVPLVKEK